MVLHCGLRVGGGGGVEPFFSKVLKLTVYNDCA